MFSLFYRDRQWKSNIINYYPWNFSAQFIKLSCFAKIIEKPSYTLSQWCWCSFKRVYHGFSKSGIIGVKIWLFFSLWKIAFFFVFKWNCCYFMKRIGFEWGELIKWTKKSWCLEANQSFRFRRCFRVIQIFPAEKLAPLKFPSQKHGPLKFLAKVWHHNCSVGSRSN